MKNKKPSERIIERAIKKSFKMGKATYDKWGSNGNRLSQIENVTEKGMIIEIMKILDEMQEKIDKLSE